MTLRYTRRRRRMQQDPRDLGSRVCGRHLRPHAAESIDGAQEGLGARESRGASVVISIDHRQNRYHPQPFRTAHAIARTSPTPLVHFPCRVKNLVESMP